MASEKVRIVGMVIQNGKILMLKARGYKELWTPGKSMEVGETDEECLQRELKEELKVKLVNCKFFKEYYSKSFYSESMVRERVYITTISGEIKEGGEISSHLWLTKEEFLSRKYPMVPLTEKQMIPDLIKAKIF